MESSVEKSKCCSFAFIFHFKLYQKDKQKVFNRSGDDSSVQNVGFCSVPEDLTAVHSSVLLNFKLWWHEDVTKMNFCSWPQRLSEITQGRGVWFSLLQPVARGRLRRFSLTFFSERLLLIHQKRLTVIVHLPSINAAPQTFIDVI